MKKKTETKTKTKTKTKTVKRKKKKLKLFRGKPGSLWDPTVDGVTASLVGSFRTCREQTKLKYVDGYTGHGTSLPIEFGNVCHYVIEHLYGSGFNFNANSKEHVNLFIRNWERDFRTERGGRVSTKTEEVLSRAVGLALIVMPQYVKRWEGDWTKKYTGYSESPVFPFEWLASEDEFCVDPDLNRLSPKTPRINKIQRSEGGNLKLLPCPIRGKKDGRFLDKKSSKWILETKTKGQIDEDFIQDTMEFDFQVMLYLYAEWKETGEVPKGILYNVIRRPGQKFGKNDSDKSFYEKVVKDVTDPNRQDHYFKRWSMEITEAELITFEQEQLIPVLQDIVDWADGTGQHYMNDFQLKTIYGKCDMYDLIVHCNKRAYFKRTKPFPELSYDG